MFADTNEMDRSLILYFRKLRETELNWVVRNSVRDAVGDFINQIRRWLA